MADQRKSGISWTDETWNPIRGCQRVNKDCLNCYAERLAATRLSNVGQPYHGLAMMTSQGPRWTGDVVLDEDVLRKPLRWQRPRMVFVNSMSDLFIGNLSNEQIDKVFDVMKATPRHTYQVLTKRPDRMLRYLSQRAERLRNVWWGCSMGHQAAAVDFASDVSACKPFATVLWVSIEPLWQAVRLPYGLMAALDWMVVGGESGPNARPMSPTWVFDLLRQAKEHGVAFHFKQWGEWAPIRYAAKDGTPLLKISVSPNDRRERIVDGYNVVRVGKRAAGREFDGQLWDEYPTPSAGTTGGK